MTDGESEFVAAWPSKARDGFTVPSKALLGCVYDLNAGVDTIEEAVFLARRDDHDELWVLESPGNTLSKAVPRHPSFARVAHAADECWCAVRRRIDGDPRASCLRLFADLTRARISYSSPDKVLVSGLIGERDLQALDQQITAEIGAIRLEAECWRSAELIQLATELQLGPEPSVHHPKMWQARCPETSHHLLINMEADEWWCGWCNRKGGIAQLRDFVEQRRRSRTGASATPLKSHLHRALAQEEPMTVLTVKDAGSVGCFWERDFWLWLAPDGSYSMGCTQRVLYKEHPVNIPIKRGLRSGEDVWCALAESVSRLGAYSIDDYDLNAIVAKVAELDVALAEEVRLAATA